MALPTVVEHLFPGYKIGYLWTVAGWDVYSSWALVGMVGSAIMTWVNILFGGAWAGKVLVLAGIGGIVTSWNAFFIGGSRAIYAMAHARMLPAFLGRLHPRYNTPVNAIMLIGALSVAAPLFGRKALVWLVDAGGLGIVLAYGTVALSFIVLRRNEPEMPRPFRVPHGMLAGDAALALSAGIMLLYMPGSPAALVWPYEWIIVLGWILLGAIFYLSARAAHGNEAVRIIEEEIRQGRTE